jgi:hypothetical protein
VAQQRAKTFEQATTIHTKAMATQAMLMLNGKVLTNSLAGATSSCSFVKKPPSSSHAQGHITAPSRFSGSRDTSPEVGESFQAMLASNIDLNTTPVTGSSGEGRAKEYSKVFGTRRFSCSLQLVR